MLEILLNSLIFILLFYVVKGRDCYERDIEKYSNHYIIPSDCKSLISSLKRIDKSDLFIDAITQPNIKLHSLDLSRNQLNSDSIGRLLNWMYKKNRKNIVELKLGGNFISNKDYELLVFIMLDCPYLKHLELQDMNLNEEMARLIYESIMSAEALEYINLERNPIGHHAIQVFADILHHTKYGLNKKLDIVHKDIYEAYHNKEDNNDYDNSDNNSRNRRNIKINAEGVIESVEDLLNHCGFPELISSVISMGARDAFRLAEIPPSYLERIGLKTEERYDFGHCVCHNFIYGLHLPKLHSNVKAEHHLDRQIPVLCHTHFVALHRQTQKNNRRKRIYSKQAREHHRYIVEPRVKADTDVINAIDAVGIDGTEL